MNTAKKESLSNIIHQKYKIQQLDGVNHLIYANKDGRFSWRPFQIIHPVIYVALAHEITKPQNWKMLTKLFAQFQSNQKISCLSIPIKSKVNKTDKAEQILHWWEHIEQASILLSLEFNHILDTDISDCYGSLKTDTIVTAIHGKNKNPKNQLGYFIQELIVHSQNPQTNGIPQGSSLMDFIAEIVLGNIDKILSDKLQEDGITEYKILRYRDDYRIFVNEFRIGEKILNTLSEIMGPFGFRMNANKTKNSSDIITQSIKQDKLAWLSIGQNNHSLQKKSAYHQTARHQLPKFWQFG